MLLASLFLVDQRAEEASLRMDKNEADEDMVSESEPGSICLDP